MLNFSLTDEQILLQDSFAKLFGNEAGPARMRAVEPLGFDPALWRALTEFGAPAARVPEVSGGIGLSLHDAVLVAEAAGRNLASVPLIEVMVAARALALSGAAESWVARITQGEAIVVPALEPARADIAQLIASGAVADAVLALDGDALVLIAAARREAAAPNSGQLPVAYWTLAGEKITGTREVIAEGGAAKSLWSAAVEEWRVLSAAWLGGLARRALELAAEYANERIQFGRPIGSFQGVAHPLAESVTAIDAGRLLVLKSVWAIATGAAEAGATISMAWWWMGKSAVTAVRRATRTLGGYGLCLEYDLQLYNRRANALVLLGGDPQKSLAQAGERLFAGAAATLPEAGPTTLDFDIGKAAEAFGATVAAFFAANQTAGIAKKAHHSSASHDKEFHRKLAQAGIIFGRWPNTPDARRHNAVEDYAAIAVMEDLNYTNYVIGVADIVGQVVQQFGTPEILAEVVPRIQNGESTCCLGFSEPSCGSDVFAARTQAVHNGKEWVINGQKMFTTAAQYADYILLLARTNPNESKHRGLSLFIVPTSLPGFSLQPVQTYMDERTNITFFSDLRLPDKYLLGEVNQGVALMGFALTLEQGSASFFTSQLRMMKYAMQWARTKVDGVAPLDDASIRARLAGVKTRFEASSCLLARNLWAEDAGIHDRAFGPMAKMFLSDSYMESCWELLEMAGPSGVLTGEHPLGWIELGHRRSYGQTIYGGTNEIHRSLIAENALGLPKSRS